MANHDYYAILQVHPKADKEVIGAAYRKLAAKHHPDVSTSPDATARMKQLNEAYEVLSDPARRMAYDRSRGIRSGKVLRSDRSWLRALLPIALMVFSVLVSRWGIKPVLLLLALAAGIWVVVKLWK